MSYKNTWEGGTEPSRRTGISRLYVNRQGRGRGTFKAFEGSCCSLLTVLMKLYPSLLLHKNNFGVQVHRLGKGEKKNTSIIRLTQMKREFKDPKLPFCTIALPVIWTGRNWIHMRRMEHLAVLASCPFPHFYTHPYLPLLSFLFLNPETVHLSHRKTSGTLTSH